MERINQICAHPLWRESVEKIQELERDRVFCGHDRAHFLDVARLAYIEALERGLSLSRELIYAAALLHDIGRHLQYLEGTPHDQASAALARQILTDCGFSNEERAAVIAAILRHRDPETKNGQDLAGVLYRADKRSRACLFCAAQAECSWSQDKKNLTLLR